MQAGRETGGEADGENHDEHGGEDGEVGTEIRRDWENIQGRDVRFEFQQPMKPIGCECEAEEVRPRRR